MIHLQRPSLVGEVLSLSLLCSPLPHPLENTLSIAGKHYSLADCECLDPTGQSCSLLTPIRKSPRHPNGGGILCHTSVWYLAIPPLLSSSCLLTLTQNPRSHQHDYEVYGSCICVCHMLTGLGQVLTSWQTGTALGIAVSGAVSLIVPDSWRFQICSSFIPAFALLLLVFVGSESPR